MGTGTIPFEAKDASLATVRNRGASLADTSMSHPKWMQRANRAWGQVPPNPRAVQSQRIHACLWAVRTCLTFSGQNLWILALQNAGCQVKIGSVAIFDGMTQRLWISPAKREGCCPLSAGMMWQHQDISEFFNLGIFKYKAVYVPITHLKKWSIFCQQIFFLQYNELSFWSYLSTNTDNLTKMLAPHPLFAL